MNDKTNFHVISPNIGHTFYLSQASSITFKMSWTVTWLKRSASTSKTVAFTFC